MIPFINLKPYMDLVDPSRRSALDRGTFEWVPPSEFLRDIGEMLDCHSFINGPYTHRLEAELATQLGAKHVVACASGTSALSLAFAAHGIDRNFVVAMPNVTFWATYEAVAHTGATPLLIDIDPDDLQMSFDEFKKAHDTWRFKAAVLPHLFGWCSTQLRNFREFCVRNEIILIEDGAQAFGVEYEGSSVFAGADTITLSFYPAKVIGGIMDGGAVLTGSNSRANTIRMLANHGRTDRYEHKRVGFNSRMSEINAAWLLRALAKSKDILGHRRALLSEYQDHHVVGQWPSGNGYLALTVCGTPTIDLPAKLAALGVGSARIYPEPISAQDPADDAFHFGDLEHSINFCKHVINLPLYYGMDPEHVGTAARVLKEVLK